MNVEKVESSLFFTRAILRCKSHCANLTFRQRSTYAFQMNVDLIDLWLHYFIGRFLHSYLYKRPETTKWTFRATKLLKLLFIYMPIWRCLDWFRKEKEIRQLHMLHMKLCNRNFSFAFCGNFATMDDNIEAINLYKDTILSYNSFLPVSICLQLISQKKL